MREVSGAVSFCRIVSLRAGRQENRLVDVNVPVTYLRSLCLKRSSNCQNGFCGFLAVLEFLDCHIVTEREVTERENDHGTLIGFCPRGHSPDSDSLGKRRIQGECNSRARRPRKCRTPIP